MSTRRIGIKFCGGCNPRIDRGQIAQTVKDALAAQGYTVVYNRLDADLIIYLSGCTANCAARCDRAADVPGIIAAGESLDAIATAEDQLVKEILRKVRGCLE